MTVVSGQLSLVGDNTGAKLMSGKIFVWLLATVLLTTAPPAEAQQPKKVPRIGYLSTNDPASESARAEGIRLALRELGYIEGQNIAIEYRYAEGKRGRFPELAAELVRLKVDIIVAAGGDRTDPGGQEHDQDDSHRYVGRWDRSCRGRLTLKALPVPAATSPGITNLTRELGGKRLELLKEVVPKLARVAVLYEPANPECTRAERGSPSRGACAAVDSSALGGTQLQTISRRYSLR